MTTTTPIFSDYRYFLRQEYKKRVTANPRYSLRSFSLDLGMPATRLSDILNKRQGLSQAYARKILPKLHLSSQEENLFLALVEREHGRSSTAKSIAEDLLKEYKLESEGSLEENVRLLFSKEHLVSLKVQINPLDLPEIQKCLNEFLKELLGRFHQSSEKPATATLDIHIMSAHRDLRETPSSA